MTTSTLELVDWAAILDDEPGCESKWGCDRPATWSWRITACGCHTVVCHEHKTQHENLLREHVPGWVICDDCLTTAYAHSPEEVGRWVPL